LHLATIINNKRTLALLVQETQQIDAAAAVGFQIRRWQCHGRMDEACLEQCS
jgi:hypothetical protein